jgi:hypothetical protein
MWKKETDRQLKRMKKKDNKEKTVAEVMIEIAAKTNSFNLGGPRVHSGLGGFRAHKDQAQQSDAFSHKRIG